MTPPLPINRRSTRAPSTMRRRRRSAFSMVELLVALAISATLLAASLQALDASWRGYKHTTESASNHVVSRIVMHRMLAMLRTGSDFAPYPVDFLDPAQNPVISDWIEFFEEGRDDALITRIEVRAADPEAERVELWYVLLDPATFPATVVEERPLLNNLLEAVFTLEFDPGPRLLRATIDMTVAPNDSEDLTIDVGEEVPVIRLVASASPRWQ